jgi:hypothetical protein
MTNERLEQLLTKCMDWIDYDNDDTKNTFEYIGFKPEELKELGFGYLVEDLVENLLDIIANDIVMELNDCEFDDITDSSGFFTIKKCSDGAERCVDVYKSTNDEKPHYVVYCLYEDDEYDYKYTDALTVDALIKVLKEFYEED